jgi:hypothetical protein
MFNFSIRSKQNSWNDCALVGFVHGVMNTDNMSILGLTILTTDPMNGYNP